MFSVSFTLVELEIKEIIRFKFPKLSEIQDKDSKHNRKRIVNNDSKAMLDKTKTKSKNKTKININNTMSEKKVFSDDAIKITQQLISDLKSLDKKIRIPESLNAWYKQAELLLEKDQRPFAEIQKVLHFVHNDAFWSMNILSIPKFRQKYDGLKLKMERGNGNGKGFGNNTKNREKIDYTDGAPKGFFK